MAPWIVPAGLHTSGRTAISTTPAAGSIDTIRASSRSGRVIRSAAEKRAATSSGDTIGFGGSVGLRGTWAKPMAPAATSAPRSSTTSSRPWADRRPRRRIVPDAVILPGAGTGRIRSVRSVVKVHASGSVSRVTPATTSTAKLITLARRTPWCSSSSRGSISMTRPRSSTSPVAPSPPGTEWRLAGRSVIEVQVHRAGSPPACHPGR